MKPNVPSADELSAAGYNAHRANQFHEAEQFYRQALQLQPNHPHALHGLGLLLAQTGRHQQAIESLQRATLIDPEWAECLNHLGLVQLQLGKLDAAAATFARVIELEPQFPDAHNSLGVVRKHRGELSAAIDCYRRAIALRPRFPEALNNLGVALQETGALNEAVDVFREAVRARSDYVEAFSNFGNALQRAGQTSEAISILQRAVELGPTTPELHYNLAIALQRDGKVDQAIGEFRIALNLRADYPDALNNLGTALHEKAHFDEAIEVYRRAIALRPDIADVHNNLGRALKELGRLDEAIDAYRQAISLKQSFGEAHSNLGTALVQAGQVDAAVSHFENALPQASTALDAQWNYALALLLRGDFERGWPKYEVRNRRNAAAIDPRLLAKFWDGSNLAGRRILLLGEQGLGDTIQFIRYVPLIEQIGGDVRIVCQPPLRTLFATQFGAGRVSTFEQPLPAFDVCCPLMSLPHLLGTTEQTIPRNVPYLRADPDLGKVWSHRLSDRAGFRIGLAWAGNPTFGNDRNRSIPAPMFAPLRDVAGVTFVSLQKGPTTSATTNLALLDFTSDLNDFADTAAAIANLDLVISVDTAVAHLAGALAKPVWTMIPFAPDWRWQLHRTDSPWYPTMRLFRQPRRGDWESVIRSVVTAIAEQQSLIRPTDSPSSATLDHGL